MSFAREFVRFGKTHTFWQKGYSGANVYFYQSGMEYAEKIIPPAADAEIEAMGELSEKDMAELVRLTTLFSHCMKERFDKL